MKLRPPLVLIVDDSPDAVDVVREQLIERGFAVVVAFDGDDAVRAAAEHAPDAVVLDLAMPRANGLDVARRLRANPRTAAVPLVLFTAHDSRELAVQAACAGFAAVVEKPGPPSRLVDVVAHLLDDAPAACTAA
jgi:CheY-like chemotaxis protein